ncbi:bifunctional precorrin-2 dehydrogenase/sirohydrochlorin ferrochelatase [Methanospirillum stamsii]|uniref:precorrin-2 dehydrogenase n=1 Tax=Methanospirillum stamsii TaxID=1277351 RepID=A0A2V2N7I0_9EURY|nr:bifunctional precorrin-2 dehydrogenase/sirohydrochlorin ferrochelatase [Methanospirillum stamsii]PWR71223.1 siroheme synthase [Methanospirillum stamsii]
MIPLMVDFTGRKVIIFGGGAVGARKARYFVEEADVTVYSRSFHPDFSSIPVRQEVLDLSPDAYSICPLIQDSALVIAATSDPDLNNIIREASESVHVFCNVASGNPGDVFLPAKVTGKKFTLAISTIGSVPAVSRLIREEMEKTFPDMDELIELGEWIRESFSTDHADPISGQSILYTALRDPETRKALSKGQMNAREYIRERYGS